MRARVIAEWLGYLEDKMLMSFGQKPARRPWVASIEPIRGRLERRFIRGQVDYEKANSAGSRGVRIIWILPPGVYEVHKYTSWKSTNRFYLHIDENGESTEIAREDIDAWVNDSSE